MKHDIVLYGAFDRHNYGDLLFPLIMGRIIAQHFPEKSVSIAGLIDSDLSLFGAPKTESIKKALKHSKNDATIILAGGDVVACDWQSAYGYLLPTIIFPFYERFVCRFFPKQTDFIVAKIAGLTSELPFNLKQKDIGISRKIIYNSVGATGVSRIVKEDEMKSLAEAMNDSTFVSVRDTFSQEQLIRIGCEKPKVAPDSATIMSSVISVEELTEKSSKGVLRMIEKLKGRYIVFQVSPAHVRGKEKVFADELNQISKHKQLPIVFIAIGNAAGHNDKAGIDKVISYLDPSVEYKAYLTGNIFDLMNIIRNSSCYCGTSLHGLITSMSFAVPRVALLAIRKQINYMKTWDLPHMPYGIMPNELEDSINIAMSTSKEQLDNLAIKLTDAYMDNFKIISEKF